MEHVNDILFDRSVRHQIYLLRYGTSLTKQVVELLDKVDDDLYAKIIKYDPEAVSGKWSRRRLEKMLNDIRIINTEAYSAIRKPLAKELEELAAYEAEYVASSISDAVPVHLNITMPSEEGLISVVRSEPLRGKLLSEWVDDLETTRYQKLRDGLRIGYVEGETIDQMVRRVRGTRARGFKDGILEINRQHAEAMVRTATNHVASRARDELYARNPHLIKGVRWVSTLDGRTTPICQMRDGLVYKVGEGPRPPAHIGCRSTTTPILKSWKEMGINLSEAPEGTRASLTGQVPASLTYGEWLQKQKPEFIEDVLGKRKAKLFVDKQLPIGRFSDKKGKAYTLAELRQQGL